MYELWTVCLYVHSRNHWVKAAITHRASPFHSVFLLTFHFHFLHHRRAPPPLRAASFRSTPSAGGPTVDSAPQAAMRLPLASVSEPGRSASTSYATARVYGVLVYWASHFCSAHLVFIRYYIDRYYQRTAWHSGCPRSTIPERERAARFSVPFLSPPYMWALLSLVKLADALLTSRLGV